MLVGVIAAFVTASTGAVFTDVAASTGNTFTAGTVDIKLNGSDTQTAQFNLSGNMAPGDGEVIQSIMSNTGSLQLRYALTITPAGTPVAISSWTGGGGATLTATTARPHALTTGEQVLISGTTTTLDGNSFSVTVTGTSTFQITQSNPYQSPAGGTETSGLGVTISGWTGGGGGSVVATTATPHGFVVGEVVQISGATGTNNATFNNHNFTITAVTSTTFTFADPGASAAALTGGAVSTYGPLLSQLQWKVMVGGSCTPNTTEPYSASANITGGTYLVGAAGTTEGTSYTPLASLTDGKVFGDPAQGPQAGDRQLNDSGGTETLCIKVIMPVETAGQPGQTPASPTPGYQGVAGTLNFKFWAEQTANNP